MKDGVIVLGSGYVSKAFQKRDVEAISRAVVPYDDPMTFRRFLLERRPHTIINASGFTGGATVDGCESKWKETINANLVLPANLSRICQEQNVRYVHVSSGCIYSGRRPDGNAWTEMDPPNFDGSLYSRTKAMAEHVVKGYILRMRMPFSPDWHPRNLLVKLLGYETLVNSENSLTLLDDFVSATFRILDEGTEGVYNAVNRGAITTMELVEIACEFRKWNPSWFGSMEEFAATVRAPRSFCVLDPTKLGKIYEMSPIRDALRSVMRGLFK